MKGIIDHDFFKKRASKTGRVKKRAEILVEIPTALITDAQNKYLNLTLLSSNLLIKRLLIKTKISKDSVVPKWANWINPGVKINRIRKYIFGKVL